MFIFLAAIIAIAPSDSFASAFLSVDESPLEESDAGIEIPDCFNDPVMQSGVFVLVNKSLVDPKSIKEAGEIIDKNLHIFEIQLSMGLGMFVKVKEPRFERRIAAERVIKKIARVEGLTIGCTPVPQENRV